MLQLTVFKRIDLYKRESIEGETYSCEASRTNTRHNFLRKYQVQDQDVVVLFYLPQDPPATQRPRSQEQLRNSARERNRFGGANYQGFSSACVGDSSGYVEKYKFVEFFEFFEFELVLLVIFLIFLAMMKR